MTSVPFRYRNRGLAVTLGRNRAAAQVKRFTFTGFLAWFMGRSYHLLMMPGWAASPGSGRLDDRRCSSPATSPSWAGSTAHAAHRTGGLTSAANRAAPMLPPDRITPTRCRGRSERAGSSAAVARRRSARPTTFEPLERNRMRGADRVVGDRDDVIDQPPVDREGQLARRRRPPAVGDGARHRDADPLPGRQRPLVSSPAAGSTPTTRIRAQAPGGGRACRRSARRRRPARQHVELADLVEQLERGRALAGHHVGVVERRDQVSPRSAASARRSPRGRSVYRS